MFLLKIRIQEVLQCHLGIRGGGGGSRTFPAAVSVRDFLLIITEAFKMETLINNCYGNEEGLFIGW